MTRVCVLWQHPLFYEAVRLLLSDPRVELVGVEIDRIRSREEIDKLAPQILILERSTSDRWEVDNLLGLVGQDVRVIWLSLDDNILSEFTRRNHTVADREDLLSLVLDRSGEDDR